MERKEFISHFPEEISDKIKTFVIDEVLLHSRYLFVKRYSKHVQRGLCTHCKNQYTITSERTLKHKDIWECEKCGSVVEVRSWGLGRGQMKDYGYAIWYDKSLIDPKSITATGYFVSLEYTANRSGDLRIEPVTRYLFTETGTKMTYNDSFKKPTSLINKVHYTYNTKQSTESIKAAVSGTTFSYSQWEHYANRNVDLVKFFTVFSKYPFVEYLIKMGMTKIVDSMVDNWSLYRSINHRGKTVTAILGLSKKEIKDWKLSGVEMSAALLATYKWLRKKGVTISWKTAALCESLVTGTYYKERFSRLETLLPASKIIKYASKQAERHKTSLTSILTNWNDYLDECEELGMNITEEKFLLPNDLYTAHRKTTKAIRIKKDELVNQKIINLQPILAKYHFANKELLIRPASSSEELFQEGEELVHCVGRYARTYSEGDTVILLIRKKDQPEIPYHTVEIDPRTQRIVQVSGYENDPPTDDVTAFLEVYKAAVLNKQPKGRLKAI